MPAITVVAVDRVADEAEVVVRPDLCDAQAVADAGEVACEIVAERRLDALVARARGVEVAAGTFARCLPPY